ncbi:GrpB-like predicted nucleotidyltransferase (UPF0157 family) [Rubricella aquisinus]|uniref:GrpB-like predicted nucleotidyltransferase (UPF0157 family) n=1 Tax=Rubricella aquisinus TaxID=2028108 RepID=A0A840WN01_9RHOB|nr:GrpB family protein [Rubricella aquisinus]MBB5516429.1 GrpB-like predicted nucleotidyltransferase (UPF0157 family) [Rubricella aquisinus]
MPVRVLPHDPSWADAFAIEAASLIRALAPLPLVLHHIGSTAIAGIHAKPIIDLLGEVPSLAQLDARAETMTRLGYEVMGSYGIDGRRYFRKSDAVGRRSHHLHMFEARSPHVARHLAFRDYLRAHADIARAYSDLKRRITEAGGASWDDYMDAKDPFVARIEPQALAWYNAQRR